jgi:hypothetical protein
VVGLLKVVIGILLAAHGLVHLLYFVTNAEDPKWPFTLERSWLLPEPARRPVAIVLIAVTAVGFVLLGLAVAGVPGLGAIWPVLAVVAAVASLLTLLIFWNVQLVAGIAIDVVVLVLAFWRPEWTDRIG